MTEKKHKNLRVFCLCGQKMQVTREMYGRPAKCVACHQKWFIPEIQEISENTEFLHLKEHPELLRLPGQFSRFSAGGGENINEVQEYFRPTPAPITEIDMDAIIGNLVEPDDRGEAIQEEHPSEEHDKLRAQPADEDREALRAPDVIVRKTSKIPLEPFEPLRLYFGYKEELRKRMEALGETTEEPEKLEVLKTYEKGLQGTLEKILHSLNVEQQSTAKQLVVIEDEIARLNIALRVGDCTLEVFISQTADLRRRRESLERHSHNLLAWSAIKDPFMAGGVADVPLESFDETTFELYVPSPRILDTEKPVFVSYSEELREMLQMRAALERRRDEWKHMVADQDFSVVAVQEGLAETEASLTRNLACIRFCHQRMEQLALDCDNDLKALNKYKEDVKDRAEKKQLRENILHEILASIDEAEANFKRMARLSRQALSANSPIEVPLASSTLVESLRGAIGHNTVAADTSLFLAAAVLIVVALLMSSETVTSETDWLAVLSACLAIGIAAFGVILDRNLRAPIVAVLWVLLLGVLITFLYYRTSMDKYLILFTEDGSIALPVFNIKGWLMVVGATMGGAGTGVAVANYKKYAIDTYMSTAVLVVSCSVISGITVASMHTFAPRTTPLVIDNYDMPGGSGISFNLMNPNALDYSPNGDSASVTGNQEEPTVPAAGEATLENEMVSQESIIFMMQGVLHGEDAAPRFKASINHPDGRVENVALKLGDAISGEWKAKEYNRLTKKLTISNGERLLVLEAGEQVALAANLLEAS